MTCPTRPRRTMQPYYKPVGTDRCTLETCSINLAYVRYLPSLAGNEFFVVLFAVLAAVQLVLGIRYCAWQFMVAMIIGCIGEIFGYAARCGMHYQPFSEEPFMVYLICLAIAPAFLSAAIYFCLDGIMALFGAEASRFQPRTYSFIFITCDAIALLLQGLGGAVSATAPTLRGIENGIDVIIAGLCWQVFSMTLFIALVLEYAWVVRCRRDDVASDPGKLKPSGRFRAHMACLGLAVLLVYTRCVFRIAELSDGFGSALANDEVLLMIFEGVMVSTAVVLLSVCHPGIAVQGQHQERDSDLLALTGRVPSLQRNPRLDTESSKKGFSVTISSTTSSMSDIVNV
ncbi:RTA1-domain-containing protein [Teratosphaeria destructans]|uniref:RTA1-domain-containing protein n=1 Tax=Teratosphaeria destructans TaxID=418781 RepID=A0A9W7W1G5_9PEZI|nr:RTA1-domain-containing protein [Teratosphaeria destructans]